MLKGWKTLAFNVGLAVFGVLQAADWVDLLGSERMRRLVEAAAKNFDYVVIDTPPLAPVVDAAVVSQLADRIVFTVAWKKTPREVVMQVLKGAVRQHKIAGIALSMIDEKRMSAYGKYGYYGSKYYGQYYQPGGGTREAA